MSDGFGPGAGHVDVGAMVGVEDGEGRGWHAFGRDIDVTAC